MTRQDRPKRGRSLMNPKITYVLLGVIFVVMALIIVNQIVTKPELETEVVTPEPEVAAPEQEAPSQPPSVAQRQPVKEQPSTPVAPRAETTPQQTPPGEKPAVAPAPAANETRADTSGQTAAAPPESSPVSAEEPAEGERQAETVAEQTAEQTATAEANETADETVAAADQPSESERAEDAAQAASQSAAQTGPVTQEDLAHKNILRLVTVEQRGGSMILSLQADEPIGRYKYFTLADPSRLVVDLIGEWEQKSPGVKVPQNELFRRIRFGRHEDKLRVVADLATTEYTEPVVVQDPSTELVVSLRKK